MIEAVRIPLHFLKRLGLLIGRFNNYLLLAISFYVLLMPIAVARRLRRRRTPTGWLDREPLPRDHFRKQF